MRTEENIAAVSASVKDDHQLLIRRCSLQIFAKVFGCEAFQNTAGARIEAERPTATQNFWTLGKLDEDA